MSGHGIRSVEMGASYIEIVCECGWRITYVGLDKRGVFWALDQHRFRARTTEGDDVRLRFGCGADRWYFEEGARDGDTQDSPGHGSRGHHVIVAPFTSMTD
jgi:hypothetical protein